MQERCDNGSDCDRPERRGEDTSTHGSDNKRERRDKEKRKRRNEGTGKRRANDKNKRCANDKRDRRGNGTSSEIGKSDDDMQASLAAPA